jgi:hypothetical protein
MPVQKVISCNILIVLTCKLTLINGHQSFKMYLHLQFKFLRLNCHISKPSDVWCPDCDEGLCTECLDHHSLAKLCRKHTTIPIAEYRKLPSYVLEIKEHCNEHHEKFFSHFANQLFDLIKYT